MKRWFSLERLFANASGDALAPLGLALILLTTFLVYLPAVKGGMLWDDDSHITRPELQSLKGLYRIWFECDSTFQYYPLLHSAFWVEHKVWGDSVLGYHLISVVWHLLAVVLVYRILRTLKIPGALLAAAIFALHPVMVESVAWISEQKNTLSTVFYLSAMLVYVRFADSRGRVQYAMALGLFVLALLTKTATVALPPALLIIAWWQYGSLSWRRDVLPLIPFFALGIVASVGTSWVERNVLGAEGSDFSFSLVQRFLLAGRAVWFYLSKLAYPAGLTSIYPRWSIEPSEGWQWLPSLLAIVVTVGCWRARKRARSLLAAWLFFCVTLFPTLGFFNVAYFLYSFVADRFQYVASLGIIALVAAGVAELIARLPQRVRWSGVVLSAAYVAAMAFLTMRQSRFYADEVTFYQTIIDHNPSCWVAHYNLGTALYASDHQRGIGEFREAIRMRPNYPLAEYNLAKGLVGNGNIEEAIDHYRQAIRLRPNYSKAHNDFGNLLLRLNRSEEAASEFQAALEGAPDDMIILNNLAVALYKVGRVSEASASIERALKSAPEDADSYVHLGLTLAQMGKNSEAMDQFRRAIEIDPAQIVARHNLGNLLAKSGKPEEAILQFEEEIHADPNNLQAYSSLIEVLAILNRPEKAIATAEKAIEVARATHQEAQLEVTEDWLKHYRIELQRGKDGGSK